MHSNNENIDIIVQLFKEHNINKVVISPGGTNIPVIKAIQRDPFFSCFSIVDERSAAYFAIGIYLQTRDPVVLLCTSAQATRNYIPGLTEAFYKRVPILALTMEKHPRFKYQEYMQAPDQTSLPKDSVKRSFELPFICDINDVYHASRIVNEAILELTYNGSGPVQLCIPWLDFPIVDEMKSVKVIRQYSANSMYRINLSNKKILLVIGEHLPFTQAEMQSINNFCDKANVTVYTNHLSNFSNDYSLNANLLLSTMSFSEFESIKPDIIITIGGQTGDYPLYHKLSESTSNDMEHWRVNEDGKIMDTYDKLTKVFHCPIVEFFDNVVCDLTDHSFYELWKSEVQKKRNNIKVPFSNVAIAQYLHNKIPNSSIIQFSILNSLRIWELFELDSSIECYSNVGAFGIDGGMSTLIGQSVVSDKLSFMVVGDLAFFYDMNSIGIRHIKENLRILLINNNGGIEFKLYGGANEKIDHFIAAANHFKTAKGWAEDCGFNYLCANDMNEFILCSELFLCKSETPILLEVFVNDDDESKAYLKLIDMNRNKSANEQIIGELKKSVKCIIGDKRVKELKKLVKK